MSLVSDISHPRVSVIIPVYGVEQFIAATVQSVLDQTYQDFEVLIIDDASPDRSVEICHQFTDPRIRIISQENRGLAGARNTGIRHAQGEFLAFLDGDDLWLPQKLEQHVYHLANNPLVGLSFSRSAFIDEHGQFLGTYLMPKLTDISVSDWLRSNPVGNGSAAVLRRKTLEEIQFEDDFQGVPEICYFDQAFRRSEDIECWLRIAITTDWQIEGLSEALTLYRVNAGGLSANLYKQLESWQQVMAKVHSYAPEVLAPYEKSSLAAYLQILARNAIRLQDGAIATDLAHRALKTYPRILLEQPQRIVPTLLVAYLLWLLPKSLYSAFEALLTQAVGASQKVRISHNQQQST